LEKEMDRIIRDKYSFYLYKQPSLFTDDGVDPNGKYIGATYLHGDWSKTGKWSRCPEGWTFLDIMDHMDYFTKVKYFYISEVGEDTDTKYFIYKPQ
jgi:hypothetical protein